MSKINWLSALPVAALLYTAKVLSLLTDSKLWPSGENCSCVTVRPCAVKLPIAVHFVVSQSQMAAVLLVCALHAEATMSPEGDAARQYSSAPWPYSFAISGQRLLCAKCSSSGAPGPKEASYMVITCVAFVLMH